MIFCHNGSKKKGLRSLFCFLYITANNTFITMTEETKLPNEKKYYRYRIYSGKIFLSKQEIPYAEKISEHKEKQMAAESPEVNQSS